ncbi:MAG: ECF-type sigma factor [Nitrosotalea sp.]
MKHIIPELEFEEIQNLTNITLSETSDSITEEKISYRRKRVNQLRLRGYINQQIAEKIGCNISTVEKDLHAIRNNARKWFNEDAITEYCQSINDGIILCDNVTEDLQILYQEDSDMDTKLKILTTISEYETKKTQLYEKTRAVQCFLRGK